MRKIILIIVMLFLAFISKQVSAVETKKYYNMIDMTKIEYNEEKDIFYSRQKIAVKRNETYTLVVTSNFFGDVTRENKYSLALQVIGTKITDTRDN